ncbi:hypothetical protein N9J03_02265 [Flavobacteriaceae bacterium]|jgi:hypothetical protein|nr:hypothetical protein [Flavobacteriaceae bacterium]
MKRNILLYELPEGMQSIFINGKSYTREAFLKAQERLRNKGEKQKINVS